MTMMTHIAAPAPIGLRIRINPNIRINLGFFAKIAKALVDAATIVIATPTVLGGAHPRILYACHLADLLRPKARYAAIMGSYGWGGKTVDQIKAAISSLTVELLDPVLVKGYPDTDALERVEKLADRIKTGHEELH